MVSTDLLLYALGKYKKKRIKLIGTGFQGN